MALHMLVVAVAAPLLALAVLHGARCVASRGSRLAVADCRRRSLELVVVWAWHVPALHHAARADWAGAASLEQASFLAAGLVFWAGGASAPSAIARGRDAGTAVVALVAHAWRT